MRYEKDVLAPGWQRAARPVVPEVEARNGLVVEDPTSGFVGAVIRCEQGIVVLADRHDKPRSFPLGPGFWIDGKPVKLIAPTRRGKQQPTHTRSGSRIGDSSAARVALPSRLYVEGRHDAELVEKIWGDDLRHVGVVVEYLGGIDDLSSIVADFQPGPGRRLGVLVDHLVTGSKESRIVAEAQQVAGEFLRVGGHSYIDIWAAVKPAAVGIRAWPEVPRGEEWKKGVCARLGWPHADQADISRAWRHILSKVDSWTDLDHELVREVEQLIDFVTADHLE